jgi:hypothetical protein
LNKYQRQIGTEIVDVYDILVAYNVTCPAIGHAVKKLLMPGQRGGKSILQDLVEAEQAIRRAIAMEEQRGYMLLEPAKDIKDRM